MINITLPVGRAIRGSVHKGYDKDGTGKPLVVKHGPNAGQPRVEFFFTVAVPKIPGHSHWRQTDWGSQIWALGQQSFPRVYETPGFAWKIVDGDSTVPNKEGNRPCDAEGAPGNWLLRLSGGYAPRVYQRDASGKVQQVPSDMELVKLGHFIQAYITVASNESAQTPGLYLNHSMVLHVGYGPEITVGPDANAVFGAAPVQLPPGASAVPQVTAPPLAAAPVVPPAAVPVAVAPNPAILAPVLPPAAPPPVVAKRMTDKAGGASYEDWIKQGWTDALLVQHGYMLP
jgi:hypothetical protein